MYVLKLNINVISLFLSIESKLERLSKNLGKNKVMWIWISDIIYQSLIVEKLSTKNIKLYKQVTLSVEIISSYQRN